MNSAFRAVKGDDGILAYTGSTFPIAKSKYREFNNILYRSNQTITGGTFNAAFWTAIGGTGSTSGSSTNIGLITDGNITGSVLSGSTLSLALGNTSVTPGTYQRATVIVDSKGRITFASGNTNVAAPAGSSSEIQFNSGGVLSANANFTVDPSTRAVTIGSKSGTPGSNSLAIGVTNASSGASSLTVGQSNAAALNSLSGGFSSISTGTGSFAFGNAVLASGSYSHAEGGSTIASDQYAHAEGFGTQSDGLGSHAGGWSSSPSDKKVLSSGDGSFNHSTNNSSQTVGHGALALYSAILGGMNHNIEVNNQRAVIIGGNGIKLTGSTYLDTVAVPSLAIFTSPGAGGTQDVLTWNPTTKKIGKVTQASLAGTASAAGSDGNIQYNSAGVFAGSNSFVYQASKLSVTLGSRAAGVTGSTSFAVGFNNIASGTRAVAFGSENNVSTTNSFASGEDNVISGSATNGVALGLTNTVTGQYGVALGQLNQVTSTNGFAAGVNNSVSGTSAVALGRLNKAWGFASTAVGMASESRGFGSFAGGYTISSSGNRPLIAAGTASFAYTYTDTSQTLGHGALADQSAILGGRNNHIIASNNGAAIIGGNSIKLDTAGYSYHTAVSNFVINDTPTSFTTQDILAWDATSKKVGKITQSSLHVSFTNVAYVSKNGNNSTATVNVANKPYLTIQAAINALPASTTTSRSLVIVMPGSYAESITLGNCKDILLNSAHLPNELINNSIVDCRIFGNGSLQKITINVGSNISINCEKISLINLLNADATLNVTANLIEQEIRWSSGKLNIYAQTITGIIIPNGIVGSNVTNEANIHANLIQTTSAAPLYLSATSTGNVNLRVKANKIINSSTGSTATSASIVHMDGSFSGNVFLSAQEMISNGSIPTVYMNFTNGKLTLEGKVINKSSVDTSAIYVRVNASGRLAIKGGTELVPSGAADSIDTNAATNVIALGQIFGKNPNDANIAIQLGSFVDDATYIA